MNINQSQPFPTGSDLCTCEQVVKLPDYFDILVIYDIDSLNGIRPSLVGLPISS